MYISDVSSCFYLFIEFCFFCVSVCIKEKYVFFFFLVGEGRERRMFERVE